MKLLTYFVFLFWGLFGVCLPVQAQFLADSNYIGTIRPILENQRDIQRSANSSSEFVPPLVVPGEKELATGALLMAVNNYGEATGLKSLNSCVNDLVLVKTWLKNKGVPEDQISVLSDDKYLLKNSEAPLSKNFDMALKTITTKKYKHLIVFCGCHGISVNGKSFLCPADTIKFLQPGEKDDPIAFGQRHNLISVDYLISELQKSGAESILLLLDACRTAGPGNFMDGFKELQNNTSSLTKGESQLAIITACSCDQVSNDLLSEPYGAFMYYFMDGLICHRADYMWIYDDSVRLMEAYYYAVAGVTQQFPDQIPMIFKEKNCNFELENLDKKNNIDEISKTKSSLKFLLLAGSVLCNNKWADNAVQEGVRILDVVLKYSPNNLQAYAIRGNALRVLKNYDEALVDMIRINQKFQLLARKVDGNSIRLLKSIKNQKLVEDLEIEEDAILTITQCGSDYYYVTEINNKKLADKSGWIFKENVYWQVKTNDLKPLL